MMKLSVCLISMLVIVSCGSSLEDRLNEVKRLELLKQKADDVVLARQLKYEKSLRQVLQNEEDIKFTKQSITNSEQSIERLQEVLKTSRSESFKKHASRSLSHFQEDLPKLKQEQIELINLQDEFIRLQTKSYNELLLAKSFYDSISSLHTEAVILLQKQ